MFRSMLQALPMRSHRKITSVTLNVENVSPTEHSRPTVELSTAQTAGLSLTHLRKRRYADRQTACVTPNNTKFQEAPCQSPQSVMVMNKLR